MIKLLTYTGPFKAFDEEHSILVKIQIDNSLSLGWKRQDIMLVTDFPFEYNGVKSIVISDGNFYDFDRTSNKIPVIIHLIESGIVKNDELYWYHDFDYYQLEQISQRELGLDKYDLGITPYGYKPQWNLGCIFFKKSAYDIFKQINEDILQSRKSNNRCDEKAIKRLIVKRKIDKKRLRQLNVSYNITKRCLQTNYDNAAKPIKALHFHPWDTDPVLPDTTVNIFMYGKNRLKKPLMNERLIKIFNQYGIK